MSWVLKIDNAKMPTHYTTQYHIESLNIHEVLFFMALENLSTIRYGSINFKE